MYGWRYLTLISCLVLAMGVVAQDEPKESHMQDSGKSHRRWVPFDMVLKDISIWRDDGIHEYTCQILDWRRIWTTPCLTLNLHVYLLTPLIPNQ